MTPAHISTVPTFPKQPNGKTGGPVFEPHGMCCCDGDPTPCRWFTPQCKRCYRPIPDQSATVDP